MKKILAISLSFFALLASLASCNKVASFGVPAEQQHYEFDAAGSTQFVSVSGPSFDVACNSAWVYTEIYRGSQAHNLRISVSRNYAAADRSAEVVVTDGNSSQQVVISIHQGGAAPYIKLLEGSVSLGMGDESFTLSALANCEFEVSTPDWVKLDQRKEVADTIKLIFNVIGDVQPGERRSGDVVLTGIGVAETVASAFVEQVGARWETVTMTWGLEDIQYIWQAFSKTTAAITPTIVSGTDFSAYPRIRTEAGGFLYRNESGDELHVILSSDAQLKINKAGSKTSTGNINRYGENVERIQMNKSTSGVGENSFMFIAPRTGVLEIEAASPNSGEKKPQLMVDGVVISDTFQAPYAIPSAVTEVPITVTSDKGAEVRIYGTGGAINYFQFTYTYQRPVIE